MGAHSELEVLKTAPDAAVQITDIARVGDNAIAVGGAPSGTGAVEFAFGADRFLIEAISPETAYFDSCDVMLAQRFAETAEQALDWARRHNAEHGANGFLFFDRAEASAFGRELAKMWDLEARAMVVSSPLPLGHLSMPPVGHLALAPRAKSRAFSPDPWLAPLGEPVLFDLLRWRFLARADTVVSLDLSDFLTEPVDGAGAFDLIRQCHTGMMPLRGRAIFPWRVRRDEVPRLEDHICVAEPDVQVPNRWGVAVKRIDAGALWLPGKIAGVPAVADEVLHYDQAMSLRFPEVEVAELVNKDLLILGEHLHARAITAGHKPIQPPAKPKPAATAPLMPAPSGRVAVVTCMKNEGPFILEWLAYHRMIGVDDFLVYTNDCDDGTDTMLDLLAARGLVQRRDNPFRDTGGKPQQSALDAARSEPLVRDAGWLLSMDVDEFINVHVGAGRLQDLFAAVPDASLISMTWRLFGNADVAAYDDRPITEQFTRCAPHLIRRPHQAWGFKTLFRNQGLFKQIGVHRPRGHLGQDALWVNGSGQPMPERMFKTGWRSELETYGYDLVTLNHYACRSVESFLVKRDRGRVNHVARDQGEAYWFRMNNNDEQDLSIQRHAHGLRVAMAELMGDPEIAAAHNSSVAAHRDKIANLRKDREYAQLYDSLTGERLRRLSRMHRHFGMNVFLCGPSVVPDKVLEPDLPPNFFFNTAPPGQDAAQ
ncbi:Glycosyl transferase, group 2 family protein [Candidatus Rhodobacter oscarellae]|uniref:Glycosyl transferase, group 2 family protein n=1 Tax=Candidatus Rhodobacter oscarellae TaxID=1675527 RepID=A0A0J9E6U9_9RHOB|nr:Glycosyl transferase, group 2 family protein [Candidatus Rhodobacter lobularis]